MMILEVATTAWYRPQHAPKQSHRPLQQGIQGRLPLPPNAKNIQRGAGRHHVGTPGAIGMLGPFAGNRSHNDVLI
jgi:hypothetical protein